MITQTRGIVLHTVPFSETSVIAKVYTQAHGMQSYIFNGVRKAKSKLKAGLLQPLTLVELVVHHKENRDIQRVTEINAAPQLISIPYDMVKSSIAFFIAEVLYKSIREEEANQNLFEFLSSHIELLDHTSESCKQFHHYFLMQLTKHLGFYPHGEYSDNCFLFDLREGIYLPSFPPYTEFVTGEQAMSLYKITSATFDEHHKITMTAAERRGLLQTILAYYELHALHGIKINSHAVLAEVMD